MKDNRALAYVNMYGILAALENLCAMDDEAKGILSSIKKPVSMCLEVANGPCCTFHFTDTGCKMTQGESGSTCKMHFSSPEKFNDMISSGKPGLPTKNPVELLKFLVGPFTKLTSRLTAVLRPTPESLLDRAFFEENTLMTFYVVAGAISALANVDPIARISAEYTVDGDVLLGIQDSVYVTLRVANHVFKTIKEPVRQPRAVMEFADIDLAHSLFAGTVSTINELAQGRIRMAGMISMIDNVNRILNRVNIYLA